jgi:hypothetical protein
MAGNLSIEQRKWILKQYWKTEYAERVRTPWVETFNTIYCIPTLVHPVEEHKQVTHPISMYKHLSCAVFKIKLTTGSGNAGRCEKFHDRNRIRLRQKAGVCASALRRRFTAARLLRSWVRIPTGAWMFVCFECNLLSGTGLCDELITRPKESYRLWCVVGCYLEKTNLVNEEAKTHYGAIASR